MIELLATITLFIFLAVLWTIDLAETIELVDEVGAAVEENPVARFLLKHGDKDFALFKLVDFILLTAIIWYIYMADARLAQALLFFFVIVYVFTVVHNYVVIYEFNKRAS